MTPEKYLLNYLMLPHLKLNKVEKISSKQLHYHCSKVTKWEVCRKCPTKSYSVYDRRSVSIRDVKIHNKHIKLIINKRRFKCPNCKSVFTEAVDGVKVGFRTTEKYRSQVLYNFRNFGTNKSIAKDLRCSDTLVSQLINERLELELRKSKNTPWGNTVLIDEHAFKKDPKSGRKSFVTALVDNSRKCLRELACSRDHIDIQEAIKHIPGRENVTCAVIDMNNSYKNFINDYFTNAKIIVDKFHVVRLIHPAIKKYRKQVTGDDRKNPIRHLLLKNKKRLKKHQKKAVTRFCKENSKVNEVYRFKERIVNFYNIKGFKQASRILTKITDDMALSKIPEILTLRKTLMKWRQEILNYFKTGLTNARIEGFNRKCKLIQRTSYGLKSFSNYRLRALYKCS